MVAAPVRGGWFTDVKAPVVAGQGVAPKTGQACASSILGLIATGDASIAAAKRAGGITKVASTDYEGLSILGVYAQFCTIVRGQ